MIKAIAVDDEKGSLENLNRFLEPFCEEILLQGTFTNAEEAVEVLNTQQPDLLFLDIQMPGKNGFEVLKALNYKELEVIFITAFDHYGIQAVKFSALDYLLKPVDREEFEKAVVRAIKRIKEKKRNVQLENLLKNVVQKDSRQLHRLALSSLKEVRLVNPQEIVHCESSNVYTTFYLENGENITVSRPIYEYEELLAEYGFVRCHQSHLINIAHIKSWKREDGDFLVMSNQSTIPVSRSKKKSLESILF